MGAIKNVLMPGRIFITKLFGSSDLTAAMILLLMCAIMTYLSPFFLKLTNLMNILRQISIIGIVAVGQQMLLVTGCVDLTVGIGMGLSGIICAMLIEAGLPAVPALILTLICGMAVGAFNGIIVTTFRTIPFITTLGTMSIVRGLSLLVSAGQPIRFDSSINFMGNGFIMGVLPVSAVIMVALVIIGHIFAQRTTFGRNMYAVGNNDKSATLTGISVMKVRMIAYMLTGMLVSISGVIIAGNTMRADPAGGFGMELEIVVACVIGGASLYGGGGTILGSMIGAMIMGVLRNAFILLGVAQYWQTMSIGILLILLVYVDVLRRKGAGEKV